jgi:hypothetical protein
VRSAIKPSFLAVVAAVGALWADSAGAADATTPIDSARRNDHFAPGEARTPQKQKPVTAQSVQEKRVEKTLVEKPQSPLRDHQAPIDIRETRPKSVREKESHRPDVREQPLSPLNHRPSATSTAGDTDKHP